MDLHLLALESSTSLCSVALLSQRHGAIRMRSASHTGVGEHAERLLPLIDELLEQARVPRTSLSAVAFGQGPGGFTGLRVACGVAQGIAFGLGIPVIPVGSLLAVAALDQSADTVHGISTQPVRVVVQDARMGEVYMAAFRLIGDSAGGSAHWDELQSPILVDAAAVESWFWQSAGRWTENGRRLPVRLVGDALLAYPQLSAFQQSWQQASGLAEAAADDISEAGPARPGARTIAMLALSAWHNGASVAPELAAPLYVRDKVAYTTLERTSGLGGNPKAAAASVSMQRMTLGDLDDVAEIEQRVQSHPWTRGNFADALAAGYSAWVARKDGRVAGFCITMFAPDVAHILVIAVTPDEQRKGIGALLLAQCERESTVRGRPSIILEVRPSNHKAAAFYRRHGFVVLSVREGYYPLHADVREDAWVMQKKLADPGASDD